MTTIPLEYEKNYVLLKLDKPDEKAINKFWIPEVSQEEEQRHIGTVLAAGPGHYYPDYYYSGDIFEGTCKRYKYPISVKEGDRVLFQWYSGYKTSLKDIPGIPPIDHDDDDLRTVFEYDIVSHIESEKLPDIDTLPADWRFININDEFFEVVDKFNRTVSKGWNQDDVIERARAKSESDR